MWSVCSSLPAQSKCLGKLFSLASALLCHLLKSSSRWKRNGGQIKTAKKMTSEVGRNYMQEKRWKKIHIQQDKETNGCLTKARLRRKKEGGERTRLQTAEFQCTTWDRLFSPNWFCHVAVGERLAKDAVVVSKENPQHVCSQHELDQTGALVGLTEHTMWHLPHSVCSDFQARPLLAPVKWARQFISNIAAFQVAHTMNGFSYPQAHWKKETFGLASLRCYQFWNAI